MLPEYDFQVLKLTKKFYEDYPNPPYKEIETKEARRYNCLLMQETINRQKCRLRQKFRVMMENRND